MFEFVTKETRSSMFLKEAAFVTRDHEQLKRAWRAAPADPEVVSALVRSCQRSDLPLPLELNPTRQIPALAEKIHKTYALMNCAGYDYVADWARLAEAPPFEDLEALTAAITAMAEESNLAYRCLGVDGVQEVAGFNLSSNVSGAKPEIYAAFEALRERAAEVLLAFPSARYFALDAGYPNDGEVYWSTTQIVYFPNFSLSYLIVMQHFW